MTKNGTSSSSSSTAPVVPASWPYTATYSFYRPHKRVQYTGDVINPVTGEITHPPSRTKQSFVAQCDINNIIKQFRQTGQIAHMSARALQGTYEDLPDPMDFQDALNIVLDSEAAFATLPSQVRARFGNDPNEFLSFMANPANQDEIIKMGLATDKRPPPPPPTPPSPSSTPSGGQKTGPAGDVTN